MRIVALGCSACILSGAAVSVHGQAAGLEKVFQDNGVQETSLHAYALPSSRDLAGADRRDGLQGFLPSCGGSDGPDLPGRYSADYQITAQDRQTLRQIMQAASGLADVRNALARGYLIGEEYEPGMGVPFGHPKLLADGKADWSRPDILLYVKRRDRQEYMLVGLVYVASGMKPRESLRLARPGNNKTAGQWREWDNLCFRVVKGRILEVEGEGAAVCPGGTLMRQAWRAHVWLPLYNPKGMLTPRNPVADHLDIFQQLQPFCAAQ